MKLNYGYYQSQSWGGGTEAHKTIPDEGHTALGAFRFITGEISISASVTSRFTCCDRVVPCCLVAGFNAACEALFSHPSSYSTIKHSGYVRQAYALP